jgi:hypothetical protein
MEPATKGDTPHLRHSQPPAFGTIEITALETKKPPPLDERERRHLMELGADLLSWGHRTAPRLATNVHQRRQSMCLWG